MRQRTPMYHDGRTGSGMSWKIRLLPVLLFVLYGAYYYFSHQELVPITGRSHLIDISYAEETQMGLESYHEILRRSHLVENGQVVDLVRTIGQRLANAAHDVDPGFQWEFNVIESGQANAFALPGGKTAVYTGLIPIAKNANGLAVVMGHEIAHAIARHGAERIAYQRLYQLGQMAVSLAVGGTDDDTQRMVLGAFGAGAQFGILLPFSRDHESEADYMGLLFVARACFDPAEAPKLWERMAEASQGQPAEFMSTHPSHETRIRQFSEWMPEALTIRQEKCRTTSEFFETEFPG